jgi:hypothetical protein
MPNDFQIVISVIEAIAGVATFGAFLFAGITFWRVRRTEQIRLAEGVLRDINTLESELMGPDADQLDKSLWDQRYFNSLDWLCLLINKKEIREGFLKEHFAPSIIYDYENIFLSHASDQDIKNPNKYAQFKKLYKELKDA